METTPCLIYDDPRPIDGVYHPGEDGGGWSVSHGTAERIVAYKEHGQGDYVPFIAVYVGGEVRSRIPAHLLTIMYAERPQ